MMGSRRHALRRGFSLVELLTVIGIIALLISILIPSLNMVRENAKKTRTASLLKGTESSLEAFRIDFGEYPDSARRTDPLDSSRELDGAYWLVRAMAGYDGQGVDVGRAMLGEQGTPYTGPNLANAQRKIYFDDQTPFHADNDPDVFRRSGPSNGARVMVDDFGYPILYYRANPKAMKTSPPSLYSNVQGARAVYNLSDNEAITGKLDGNSATFAGWDFAGKAANLSVAHPLAQFGDPVNPDAPGSVLPGTKGQTFIGTIHDHQAGKALKAANPNAPVPPVRTDSYLLISPGPDGMYGTNDDVNNFGKTL